MKLTSQQRVELLRHKIPDYDVFNAAGMTLAQAKAAMSVQKEAVMVNGPRCQNDQNHTLRSRYGKCVGCNPATISMQKRKSRPGAVYLVESPAMGLVKVGLSIDHKVRLERLNYYAYGGASDWRFVAVAKAEKAGELEHTIHVELERYKEPILYDKDGKDQACYELFRCDPALAFKTFRTLADDANAELIVQPGKL